MENMRNAVFVLALLLLVPGSVWCQDTIRVRADNDPLWGTAVLLAPELRIGAVEGSEKETFGQLMGVVVGPEGQIVVADWQGPSIRVFDSTGTYLRDLGRPGQGPGEFQSVLAIQGLPSGDVAVWDPRNQRITTFGLDGSFRGSVRAYSGLFTADPFRVDSAGTFYVKAIRAGTRRGIGIESAMVWLKIDADGTLRDSIPIPMRRQSGAPVTAMTPAGARKPFPLETVSAQSPWGYEVRGYNARLGFERTLRDGRVLRVDRSSATVPVESQERDQWREWSNYLVERGSGSVGIITPVPSRKPAFREIWVDQDGRVWLSRYVAAVHRPKTAEELAEREGVPPIEWFEPPTWDVFDPRGSFLGTIMTPERGVPVAAKDDRVWFIEQGEFRENYVTRYRIAGVVTPSGDPAFP